MGTPKRTNQSEAGRWSLFCDWLTRQRQTGTSMCRVVQCSFVHSPRVNRNFYFTKFISSLVQNQNAQFLGQIIIKNTFSWLAVLDQINFIYVQNKMNPFYEYNNLKKKHKIKENSKFEFEFLNSAILQDVSGKILDHIMLCERF